MPEPWLDLAERNAARFVTRICRPADRDDFFQIARLAAWQASNSWRPGGMNYRSWVAMKTWNAMLHALSTRAYGDELGRTAYHSGERRTLSPLPDQLPASGSDTLDPADQLAEDVSYRQLVAHGLTALTPREATIVSLHDLDGYRQEDIGEAMGISSSRVSQIRTVALEKMHDRLAA